MTMKNRLCAAVFLVSLILISSAYAYAENERIVATVGKETITEKQLDAFFEKQQEIRKGFDRQDALDELVIRSVLYQEAKQKELHQRTDIREMLLEAERKILIDAMAKEESLIDKPVTDDMAKQLYDQNYMGMRYPRWVELIVVKVNYAPGKEKEGEQFAYKLKEELPHITYEKDYQAWLQKVKTAVSPPDGIKLDAAHYQKMFLLKARHIKLLVEEAALALTKGDISNPYKIHQQPEYWVFYLADEYQQEEIAFDKVRSALLIAAGAENHKKMIQSYLEKARERYRIEYSSEK